MVQPQGRGRDALASFDLDVFEASVQGYTDAGPRLSDQEREALAFGVEVISLELAARFLADALNESYFGWNRDRFPAAGEHNLLRGRGQWSLHDAALATRSERLRILS